MKDESRTQDSGPLQVGDLLTVEYYGSERIRALVYKNMYGPVESGLGVILSDGTFLGIMDTENKSWTCVEFHHNTGLEYQYQNPEQVQHDYQAGLFTPYFEIL